MTIEITMLTPVTEPALGFGVRTLNCLRNDNIHTIEQITFFTPAELLRIPYFGRKCLNEISDAFIKYGIAWDYTSSREDIAALKNILRDLSFNKILFRQSQHRHVFTAAKNRIEELEERISELLFMIRNAREALKDRER
jgi:hypothetical protein